jgi:hypothetical protein
MRKLIITSLMLLGSAGSALGQHRVVKLNSSQVQGQAPKADSITVVWDDGEGRHRWSSISIQGPVQFVTRDITSMSPYSPVRYLTRDGSYRDIHYLTLSRENGDTILGYQTRLILAGPSQIHYSKDLGMDLKAVSTKDDTVEISEAASVDEQGNFDPGTVDLSAVEQAASSAEAAGHGDYAKQIRRLVRRWQKAAANWPN